MPRSVGYGVSGPDPEFFQAFGAAVAALRIGKGWTRKKLSKTAEISYSYLSAIEAGERLPSAEVRRRLAEALGMAEAELIAHSGREVAAGVVEPSRRSHVPAQDRRLTPPPPEVAVTAELEALLRDLDQAGHFEVLQFARGLGSASGRRRVRREALPAAQEVETRAAAFQVFWRQYLQRLESEGLDWASGRWAPTTNYFPLSSPISGTTISASFARGHLLRHELYINLGIREASVRLLDRLEKRRAEIEVSYGRPLRFERPVTQRSAVRMAEYRPGHIGNVEHHDGYIRWFIDAGRRLRRTIDILNLRELGD